MASRRATGTVTVSVTSGNHGCYACGEPGHFASACPSRPRPRRTADSAATSNSNSNSRVNTLATLANNNNNNNNNNKRTAASSSSSQPNNTCFKCGEPGHWARDCPSSSSSQSSAQPPPAKRQRSSSDSAPSSQNAVVPAHSNNNNNDADNDDNGGVSDEEIRMLFTGEIVYRPGRSSQQQQLSQSSQQQSQSSQTTFQTRLTTSGSPSRMAATVTATTTTSNTASESPARSGNCFRCGQPGHWANECPNGAASPTRSTAASNSSPVSQGSSPAARRSLFFDYGQQPFADRIGPTTDLAPGTSRVYLNVPFAEKDDCKARGGRWDNGIKKWYVPDGRDVAAFQQWLL